MTEQIMTTKHELATLMSNLVEDLEIELGYAKTILETVEYVQNQYEPIDNLDITDELDYLVRDLNPRAVAGIAMQDRGFDTYSSKLKEVLEYIQSKNKQ